MGTQTFVEARPSWHSRGYLPHFDSTDAVQFVTFRLADVLPRFVRERLDANPDSLHRLFERERYLDIGHGACFLRRPRIAQQVEDSLLHFDRERYRLLAWVLMPNHVHVVIEVASGWLLGKIVKTWKAYSARQANALLGRRGRFWFPDYHDRYVRNEEHLRNVIRYVHGNPVKAGLVPGAEKWPWSSACKARV